MFSTVLYHFIAYPLIKIINRFYFGLRIENRRVIKNLNSGCFLYSNHTQHLDPFISAEVAGFGRRAYFMAGPDTFSISGIRYLVTTLGAMPVGFDIESLKEMMYAVKKRYAQKACITIYPKAHIGPYYTGIRKFKDVSFAFPVGLDSPVVAMVVTHRKRKGPSKLIFKHPKVTVYCSEPMYVNPNLGRKVAKTDLCERVYAWMKKTAKSCSNYEFIKYSYRPLGEDDNI